MIGERVARALVLSLAALALAAFARVALATPVQRGAQPREEMVPFRRGFAVNRDVNLRVMIPRGAIDVVAWDRDSIDVTGVASAASNYYGGGAGTHAKFGLEASKGSTVLPRADVTIRIPRAARAWFKVTTGDLRVTGAQGELELYAVGGSITVNDARGVVSIESIDAPVTVARVNGALRVRGSKGRIAVHDVRGTATVTSVSGDVTLSGPLAPDARIETIGGRIRTEIDRYGGATLELQTHDGPIDLVLDMKRRPVLELSSRQGRMPKPTPAGDPKEGRIIARSFKGGVNVIARSGIPSP